MGNCIVVHNDNRIVSLSPQDDEKLKHFDGKKQRNKKKMNKGTVRFNVGAGGDDGKEKSDGVRRIRVLVTKQELREILMQHGNELKLEQIVKAVKSRRRNVKIDGDDDCDEEGGGWRPTLESIPEDH